MITQKGMKEFWQYSLCRYHTLKWRFSRPNRAWLFTADVTFIYISIENGLGL